MPCLLSALTFRLVIHVTRPTPFSTHPTARAQSVQCRTLQIRTNGVQKSYFGTDELPLFIHQPPENRPQLHPDGVLVRSA
jgi:hypothetical protein